MTYLYILAGIWTFLAMSWSVAFLQSDGEAGKPSKLERFIRSKEELAAAYKNHES
jgi:hypothetical protein